MKKAMKKAVCFLLMLCLLAGLVPAAASSSAALDAIPRTFEGEDPEQLVEEYSWDELVERIIDHCRAEPNSFALGYRNTVTGEEHYYDGDRPMNGASLYKTPLNMLYAEKVSRGEITLDEEYNGQTLRELQAASLIYSSNSAANLLMERCGGWVTYRRDIAGYLGRTEEEITEEYLGRKSLFTARELTVCMDLLAREPERFPDMLECLLEATPGLFLEYADVPYEIAQKFGYWDRDGALQTNACGIVYTEEPIVLTVLTSGMSSSGVLMRDYTELCCVWAEYQHRLHVEEEARIASEKAAEEARLAEEARIASEKAAEEARLAEEARIASEKAAEEARLAEETRLAAEARAAALRRTLLLCAAGAGAAVFAVCVLRSKKRKKGGR